MKFLLPDEMGRKRASKPMLYYHIPALALPLSSIYIVWTSPQHPMTNYRSKILASYPSISPGFSLVELLVVVAVVGMLAVMTVPTLQSIASAGNLTRGAHDVAGLLELARNEAVARQTYVWVGFSPSTEAGGSTVRMAAVYSLDGSGTNASASNLGQLSKIILIRDVMLTNWSSLKSGTKDRFASLAPASVSTNASGIQFDLRGIQFSSRSITFTPRGEALLTGVAGPYEGYDNHLDVSLVQTKGMTAFPNADDAAVLIDGASGLPNIVQLQ